MSVDAATSALWAPGDYDYQAVVVKGTEEHTVEVGSLKILVNLRTLPQGYDSRTHAQKMLDAIIALEESRATKEESEYLIGTGPTSRHLKHLTPNELLIWRRHYQVEVEQEKQQELLKEGNNPGNTIKVQF